MAEEIFIFTDNATHRKSADLKAIYLDDIDSTDDNINNL
jgi:hypothetical protein